MLIGREKELQILQEAYESEYSEFAVVYGRRRVGENISDKGKVQLHIYLSTLWPCQ
jgi:hypothetical protein